MNNSQQAKALRSYAKFFRGIGYFALIGCLIAALLEAGTDDPSAPTIILLVAVGNAALIQAMWGSLMSEGLAELLEPTSR